MNPPPGGDGRAAGLRAAARARGGDPQLHLRWDARTRQIRVQLMGQVQQEILQKRSKRAFGLRAEFDAGSVVYLETIAEPVEGVGHYEPLRHYAEVHSALEPGEPGSGIQIDTMCSEDALSRNWQRLIFTHLLEKTYRGVLIGAPLTGCAHHARDGPRTPEAYGGRRFPPGDVPCGAAGPDEGEERPARAVVRRSARPSAECVGRAMSDLERMGGAFDPPEQGETMSTLRGSVPVAQFGDYAREFAARIPRAADACSSARRAIVRAGSRRLSPPRAAMTRPVTLTTRPAPSSARTARALRSSGTRWSSYAHLPLLNLRRADEPSRSPRRGRLRGRSRTAARRSSKKSCWRFLSGRMARFGGATSCRCRRCAPDDKRELIRALEPAEEWSSSTRYISSSRGTS